MSHGKNICQQLKAIRRSIAEENNIPLEIPVCTYQGECAGTCPQCEAEVRFLEKELARRLSLGKAATVAGIAVALASPAAAQVSTPTQDSHLSQPSAANPNCYNKPTQGIIPNKVVPDSVAQPIQHFTFQGKVLDKTTQEPIVFANVILKKGDRQIRHSITDFDGNFKMPDVPLETITTNSNRNKYYLQVSYIGYYTDTIPWDETSTEFLINLSPTNEILEPVYIEKDPVLIGVLELDTTLLGTPASESGDPNAPRIRIKEDDNTTK